MAVLLENPGGHAREEVWRNERESWVPLFPSSGRGTHRSPTEPLERREVHRLPEGDPPARRTHHQVL